MGLIDVRSMGCERVGGMSEAIEVIIGRRLKARRRLIGLTQQQLADGCGVTFQQVQKYECAACRISAHMLWKLALRLEVDISYFFDGVSRETLAPHVPRAIPDAQVLGASL